MATSHFAGTYLGTRFLITVSAGLDIPELADFLDAHALPEQEDLRTAWHIHVISAHGASFEKLAVDSGGCSWVEPSGVLTVTHWESRVRYHLVPAGTPAWPLVQDIYCGIRRLAIASHGACVLLHMACVRFRGRVIALFGNKGSGKTVATQALMLQHGACYLSGDKACVWLTPNDGVACGGLMSAVRVRLADRPLLGSTAAGQAVYASAAELAADEHRVLGDKVCLAPAHFCRLAGVEPVAVARPDYLIFLRHGAQPQPVTTLAREEIRLHLEHHRIEERSPVAGAQSETARVSRVLRGESAGGILDELASNCVGYALTERPDVRELLDRIDRRLA